MYNIVITQSLRNNMQDKFGLENEQIHLRAVKVFVSEFLTLNILFQ